MTDAPDPEAPQVEDGYFRVANTLQIGLMTARVRVEARFILGEVVGQWLGKTRATTFRINVPKIAERWGLGRTNTWRGFRQLKEEGILIAIDGDEMHVKIDKRALMQTLPENVRAGLKSFADDARNGEWFGQKTTTEKRIPQDTGTVSHRTLDRIPQGTHTVSPEIRKRIPQDTIGGGVYKEEEVEELNTHTKSVGVCGSIQSPDSKPEHIGIDDPRHPANADDLKPHSEFVHSGPVMPEMFNHLVEKAKQLFRGQRTSFPNLLAGKRSEPVWVDLVIDIPEGVWFDALRSVANTKDPAKWSPEYYLAIVRNSWERAEQRRKAGEQMEALKKPKPVKYSYADDDDEPYVRPITRGFENVARNPGLILSRDKAS